MKINGFVYIIVGLILALSSRYFSSGNLKIFFYIGLLFILIGAIKLVLRMFSRGRKSSTKGQVIRHQPHDDNRGHPRVHHVNPNPHHGQHVKYCSRCNSTERMHANFCSHCGNRQFYRK